MSGKSGRDTELRTVVHIASAGESWVMLSPRRGSTTGQDVRVLASNIVKTHKQESKDVER
jgi:hypothetical protein